MEAFLKALPPDPRREVLRTKTTFLEEAWEKAERHHQIMQILPPAPVVAAATDQDSTPSRLEQLEATIAAFQRQLLNDKEETSRKPEPRRERDGPRC